MTSFVLDASVALAWSFEDENSPYSEFVIGSLDRQRASVPAIWPLEVTNALLVAIRQGRIERAAATRLLGVIDRFPLDIDRASSRIVFEPNVLDIGLTHNLTAYDASYLELARRRGIPLATQDKRLAEAGHAAGVEILQP